jgi:hypothetical protein
MSTVEQPRCGCQHPLVGYTGRAVAGHCPTKCALFPTSLAGVALGGNCRLANSALKYIRVPGLAGPGHCYCITSVPLGRRAWRMLMISSQSHGVTELHQRGCQWLLVNTRHRNGAGQVMRPRPTSVIIWPLEQGRHSDYKPSR